MNQYNSNSLSLPNATPLPENNLANISLTNYQKQLFLKLIEMKFEPILAISLILCYPEHLTLNDFLNKFIADENGIFDHVFLFAEDTPLTCKICGQFQEKHRKKRQKEIDHVSLIHNCLMSCTEKTNPEIFNEINTLIEDSKNGLECLICMNKVAKQFIFHDENINHQICINCLKEFIRNEINKGKLFPLKCPHCDKAIIDLLLIKPILDNRNFMKFQRLACNHILKNNDNFFYCPGCSKTIYKQECLLKKCIDENLQNQGFSLFCPNCSLEICEVCLRKQHFPILCETMNEKELVFLSKIADIQKCPSCKFYIEKIKGCNHITCFCGYEFCWLCGSKYSSTHYMNENNDKNEVCPFISKQRNIIKVNSTGILKVNTPPTLENSDIKDKLNNNFNGDALMDEEEFLIIEKAKRKEKLKWYCLIVLAILFLPIILIVFPIYSFIQDILISECWRNFFRTKHFLIKILVLAFISLISICVLPLLWIFIIFKLCFSPNFNPEKPIKKPFLENNNNV